MAYEPDPKAAGEAVKKASRAVDELRNTIGLPSDTVAKEISTRIAAIAKEKGVVVEWNVRVIRPGSPVEALCNCTCYA